ncbi:hypothetical protein CAC42_7215 [Sphaceloma murrayae]|uniref:CinA C-terminal domain-containing protein n=1 Tax=Sphaceloma murrayae TaxID=2082308 RepID=A0A2K1QQ57_9PEZI|nr:hypothetical protein CAC42_7215 [Sphaceloma murrayae]
MPPAFPPPTILPLITALSAHLHSTTQTIAFAETASGGLISSSLLSLPSASKIYRGGLTLYTLESRLSYAGWTEETRAAYRGPTPSVVAGLAANVRKELGPTWVLAESGTAGPTGGSTRNRTPGYVALAVAGEGGIWTREVETGTKDRVENMLRFAEEAIKFALEVVKGEVEPDKQEETEAEGKL